MMLEALPAAKTMLADRAYDARWFRQGACRARDHTVHPAARAPQDPAQLRSHPLPAAPPHREHVRTAERLARIHTRYDRCADIFLAAITLAATFLFWLNES